MCCVTACAADHAVCAHRQTAAWLRPQHRTQGSMFDSQYMLKTHQHVSYVFEMYVWCHCVLQIMRYVRTLKLQDGYDPNTTHIVYGQVGGSDATDAAAAEQQQPGDVFAAPVWVYLSAWCNCPCSNCGTCSVQGSKRHMVDKQNSLAECEVLSKQMSAVCCCCCLQDADLLLLSLLTHEPHFIVMRENMEAGVSKLSALLFQYIQ